MEDKQSLHLVMVPAEDMATLLQMARQILARLDTPTPASPAAAAPIGGYITAKEFMDATRIKRTKFNSLVLSNKIKTIKKSRKVLVPASEVQRYFTDPTIQ